jgi:hypothetical protein
MQLVLYFLLPAVCPGNCPPGLAWLTNVQLRTAATSLSVQDPLLSYHGSTAVTGGSASCRTCATRCLSTTSHHLECGCPVAIRACTRRSVTTWQPHWVQCYTATMTDRSPAHNQAVPRTHAAEANTHVGVFEPLVQNHRCCMSPKTNHPVLS